jgi:acyl-CoA reductase-like NAD-dependent aldehyde dehydrogenase
MFIDGKWTGGHEPLEVMDPATEETVDRVPNGTTEDVDRAVKAAQAALEIYSSTPIEQRHQMMQEAAILLKERAGDMAPLLTREQGKPLEQAKQEIFYSGMVLEQFVGLEPTEELLKETQTARMISVPQPIGVCGLILPWNFPAAVMMWKLAPALLCGNTTVIKPSPYTPLTNLKMAEVMTEVFPKGVINVVTGGNETGKALVQHPGISKISFTGHVDTGPKIVQGAGVKHVTLELGGNDPAIVLPDYDPATIPALWGYVFRNAGQICTAIKRIYVHTDVYDEFLQKFIELTEGMKLGNGQDEGVTIGPVNNYEQFEKVRSLVEDAIQRGAKAETGGSHQDPPGFFYPPTVLTGCKDDWPIVKEEQFGPAIPILTYEDIDDVIKRANSTRYGLGGSIWTGDLEKGRTLAERLECGITWVNAHGAFDTAAPFGGYKDSGFGKELGKAGAEEYVKRKTIYTKL